VNTLKEFVIPVSGLKESVHHYEFEINNSFFEAFESSEIKKGNLKLELKLDKKARMMVFEFSFKGFVEVTCDRCLDIFDYLIEGIEKIIFKYGTEDFENTDEIIVLPENAYQVDISKYIHEILMLKLPIQRIHPNDGVLDCNPEIVKKLEEHKKKTDIDPRWEGLKGLIND
jgi:uncharacterized metal-binding protein YceD (DUF177 family)